ncbi:GNAT family N-acetyltransferase [Shewanella baltica]|uniref:GNAT family N-acetyltransferase n=1 Tax=Shewanella baltica TaxID=62322 RepID=UPI003D7A6890
MIIRDATQEDISKIVEVHRNAFQGFFLTTLGRGFLTRLYEGFLFKNDGILRVAIADGEVIGFSAGTTTPETFFAELRRDKWLSFLRDAIPGLMLNPAVVIKKLYHALFYKGDPIESLKSAALLSSIAVDPSCTGKSIGKVLLEDYELQVSQRSKLEYVYLITDKFGNERVVNFYKKLQYIQDSEFCQSGNRVMLRFIKKII